MPHSSVTYFRFVDRRYAQITILHYAPNMLIEDKSMYLGGHLLWQDHTYSAFLESSTH